jgi:flagellar basal-body rod modification protein FlgD
MYISPVTSAAGAASAPTANTLNYDAFLRLLVAQMKNQDPTEPTDSSQYLSQLASFSAVEQAVNTNAKLNEMMTSLALSQADSLIGRTITSGDGSTSGIIKSIQINADGSTAVLDNGQTIALGAGVIIS